jgi:hypothetical protein
VRFCPVAGDNPRPASFPGCSVTNVMIEANLVRNTISEQSDFDNRHCYHVGISYHSLLLWLSSKPQVDVESIIQTTNEKR